MPHDIAATRRKGDYKDTNCPESRQTFDFSVKPFDLSNIDDADDGTMVKLVVGLSWRTSGPQRR